MKWLLVLLHRFIVWLTSVWFQWRHESANRGIPPANDPILMTSAVELASKIRKRQLTSFDVVSSFVNRIRQVNPYLNIVVGERFHEALREAQEIDRILDSGKIPDSLSETNAPFLGVPVTTKESVFVAGLPNTSGLPARKGVIAKTDSDGIAAMRKAGAIPLAVTNVSELCMWVESNNLIYGRSNNAYHQGRTVGGSSGGEGCIQSAAASPFGIGTDLAGSIRLPAIFNGVFGHKPTTGIVSNKGQFPEPVGESDKFVCRGPMSRYAQDLLPMLRVLVFPEQRDRLFLDDKVDVRKLKYFYMEDDGGGDFISSVTPLMAETIKKAANHFASLGCSVKKVSFPQLKLSFQIWFSVLGQSGGKDPVRTRLAGGPPNPPVDLRQELLLWLIGKGRHTFPGLLLGLLEVFRKSPEDHVKLRQLRDSLLGDLEQALGNDGVFIYPPFPHPAPYHNQTLISPRDLAYTGIFNVLGLPSTAVPMGISPEEGVPVGLQVVASRYCDRLSLAVAVELERAFGGWVPPFRT